jgi:hypothetical protein
MNPFNTFDVLIVTLDWVLQSISNSNGIGVSQTRIIRFVRLLRLLRAIRLLRRIQEAARKVDKWKIPTRHASLIPENEIRSLVGIIEILTMVYDRIQDSQLGLQIT